MEGVTLEKLKVIIEAYTKPYKEELEKIKQVTGSFKNQVNDDTNKIKGSYSKVGDATREVMKETKEAGNTFRKLGSIIAGVVGVGALASFTKSCVDLGSDLQEVQNVVDVSFGSMTNSVNEFANNAIEQFGLSELSAKKYMGTYGAMAKSFGFNQRQVYDMSAAITGLTGDVASFYNLTQDEAYTKLKSIFTGETETLKDLGVVMTQTALDQYALNEGLGKTTAKMTEQEKVMLRYQFVMSRLSGASGDFARTQDSWANQIRILTLRFEQFKATVGQGLINIFTPAIRVINSVLARLQVAAQFFKEITQALFGKSYSSITNGATGASNTISGAMADANNSSAGMADNVADTANSAKELKNQLMGFDEINLFSTQSSLDSGAGGTSGGIDLGGIDTGLGYLDELNGEMDSISTKASEYANKIKNAFKELKEICAPTTDSVKRLWNEGLSKLGKFSGDTLTDFYNDFLVPFGVWTLGEGFPRFFDITNRLLKDINWANLNRSLDDLWKYMDRAGRITFTNALDFYEFFLKPLGVWAIGEGLPDLLNAFTDMQEMINWEKLSSSFRELWKALGPFSVTVGKGLVSFVVDLSEFITPGISKSVDIFSDALVGIADVIKSIPEPVVLAIGEGLGAVLTVLVGYKAVSSVPAIVTGLQSSFGGLLSSLAAHPYVSIAAGIAGVTVALSGLARDGFFSDAETKAMCARVDDIISKSKECTQSGQKLLDAISGKYGNIEATYGVLQELSDRYFDLSEKVKLTNEEQAELDTIRNNLSEKLPGFSDIINDNTKSYSKQKLEIEKLIDKTQEYYMAQAAQEVMVDTYKKLYESQKILSEAEKERNALYDDYINKMKSYKEASGLFLGMTIVEDFANELDPVLIEYNKLTREIEEQKKNQQEYRNEIEYSIRTISDYNSSLDDSGNKIKTYAENTSGAISSAADAWKSGKNDFVNASSDIGTTAANTLVSTAGSKKQEIRNQFGDYAIQSKNAFTTTLQQQIQGVATSVTEFGRVGVLNPLAGLPNSFSDKANSSVDSFNDTIHNRKWSTEGAVSSWANLTNRTFADVSNSGTFNGFGSNIVSGFNNGISTNQKSSVGVIGDWAIAIKDTFRNNFQIHSPSRLFKGFGEFVIGGFNEGIKGNIFSSVAVMKEWGKAIEDEAPTLLAPEIASYAQQVSSFTARSQTFSRPSYSVETTQADGENKQPLTLVLEVNGRKFYQATMKDFEKEARRQGGLRIRMA